MFGVVNYFSFCKKRKNIIQDLGEVTLEIGLHDCLCEAILNMDLVRAAKGEGNSIGAREEEPSNSGGEEVICLQRLV